MDSSERCEVILYADDDGYSSVQSYLDALSRTQKQKALSYIDRLVEHGHRLRRPSGDSLGGGTGLYELRPARHRLLYFFESRSCAVIVHAFLKRTDEIPMREIRTALKRKQRHLERMRNDKTGRGLPRL